MQQIQLNNRYHTKEAINWIWVEKVKTCSLYSVEVLRLAFSKSGSESFLSFLLAQPFVQRLTKP